MSDVYPARDPLIVICDPPENRFSYVNEQQQGGSKVVFWLGIRKKALRRWCQLQKETSGLKHVDMGNENIPRNTFKIDPESKRVKKRLTRGTWGGPEHRNTAKKINEHRITA